MDQNALVTSNEIVAFLDQQTIGEEKATGLRLLRRAANTIDQLNEQLESNDQEQIQISIALGVEGLSLEGILQKIEDMHTERNQHIEAIQQRDAIIEAEYQSRATQSIQPHVLATPDQAALQHAMQFSYALVGLCHTQSLPAWVVSGARDIIDYVEHK